MKDDGRERHNIIDLEQRLVLIENRLASLEVQLEIKPKSVEPPIENKEAIIEHIEHIGIQNLVIMCLRLKGPQTRDEIRDTLVAWGKPINNWFDGGNFNNRLIKNGIVRQDGKNDKGDVYKLTLRGEKLADEKLENPGLLNR